MDIIHTLYRLIDRILIFPFRIPGGPIIGYFFGTAVLAVLCAAASQVTMAVGMWTNRKTIIKNRREMVSMHNLSFKSLAAKDKAAYKSCNREANDAFGKFFFSRAAVGMASLWPVAFALAWMDLRFSDVSFDLGVTSVGYPFTFIPLYILARIVVAKFAARVDWLSTRLPEEAGEEKMLGLSDLARRPESKNRAI